MNIAVYLQLEHGDAATIERVENEMPRRVKKRRQIQTEEGVDAGWEEYYDYIFPSDQGMLLSHLRISR